MPFFLGIDVGTTGTKTILINENGKIYADAYEGYSLNTIGSFIEQDALDWYKAVVNTIRSCIMHLPENDKIYALSLSTQGGALVPTDCDGTSVYPAISWMDKRAGTDNALLESLISSEEMYAITGLPIINCLPLLEMMWLKKHRPDIFNKADKFLTTVEYINYRLTGKMCGDPSNMAFTQLFDIHTNDFSSKLMELAGISRDKLPDIVPSGKIIGQLTENAAKELGLDKDTIVVSGGHDQYCGALGSNTVCSGDVMLATGTAWVVLAVMEAPPTQYISGFSVGRHIIENKWGVLASQETGGVSIEWFKNKLGIANVTEKYEQIDNEASKKPLGSDGVFFYPYFDGSYYPAFNKNNKGTFLGLNLSHDRYHMARAIMEGVTFELRRMLEGLEKENFKINRICLTGGATKSSLWTEMISNIIGKEIFLLNTKDAPCMGAAIIAMYGAGFLDDMAKGASSIIFGKVIQPNTKITQEYESIYKRYCDKYEKLCNIYE